MRSAKRNDLACPVRASGNVKDLVALDVHARHQDSVSPGKLAFQHRANVFIDEPDLPLSGHERRNK
jgi:hypothetical protein